MTQPYTNMGTTVHNLVYIEKNGFKWGIIKSKRTRSGVRVPAALNRCFPARTPITFRVKVRIGPPRPSHPTSKSAELRGFVNGSWRGAGELDQIAPPGPFSTFITREGSLECDGCGGFGAVVVVFTTFLLRGGFRFDGLDHKKEPGENYRYDCP